jgi:hypothetical protein
LPPGRVSGGGCEHPLFLPPDCGGVDSTLVPGGDS